MSTAPSFIRRATTEDIAAINAIHKHYVTNTVITFVTEPNSDEATLANYNKVKDEGLPYLVAMHPDGTTILGYTYVSSFRGVKPGYRHTLELSLFVHPDHVRREIGRQLLNQLIDILKHPQNCKEFFDGERLFDFPPRQLMAVMAVDIDMPGKGWKLRDWYVQQGFEQRAHLKEVGWKKERWVDTVYLQLGLWD